VFFAARQHAGIAYVSLRSVQNDINEDRLIQLLPEWTPTYPGIALFYPSRRLPSAGLQAFIDHVQAWRKAER